MRRMLSALVVALVFAAPAFSAVLVFNPSTGTYTPKSSLLKAATDADTANKAVVVATPQSATYSNISSSSLHAWPKDRKLKVEMGGSIGNTTLFRFDGPFEAGLHKVFAGAGKIL